MFYLVTLILCHAGRPGSTICLAIRSASTTGTPSSRNIEDTVLLPVPTPPVKPTRNIFKFGRYNDLTSSLSVYECICVCKRVCKVALKFSFALVLSHQITIKVSHTIKLGTKKCCGGGSFEQFTVDGLILLSMCIHHGSERFCKCK